jgi:hypothetical protein
MSLFSDWRNIALTLIDRAVKSSVKVETEQNGQSNAMTKQVRACCSSPAAIRYWFIISLMAWGVLSLVGILLASSAFVVDCVVAAGGLAPDHSRWISSRCSFFLPVKVLSRVFRGKFIAGLKTAFH